MPRKKIDTYIAPLAALHAIADGCLCSVSQFAKYCRSMAAALTTVAFSAPSQNVNLSH